MELKDLLKAIEQHSKHCFAGGTLKERIVAANRVFLDHSSRLIKGDCCNAIKEKILSDYETPDITTTELKNLVTQYSNEINSRLNNCNNEIAQVKEQLESEKNNTHQINQRLQNLLADLKEGEKVVKDFEECKTDLANRLTKFEVDQKIKEEVNTVWNQAIASSRITFRNNARLQSELAGVKQLLEETQRKAAQQDEQIKTLRAELGRLDCERILDCVQDIVYLWIRWIAKKILGIESSEKAEAYRNYDPEDSYPPSNVEIWKNIWSEKTSNFASAVYYTIYLGKNDYRQNTARALYVVQRALQLALAMSSSKEDSISFKDFNTGLSNNYTYYIEITRDNKDNSSLMKRNYHFGTIAIKRKDDGTLIEGSGEISGDGESNKIFPTLRALLKQHCPELSGQGRKEVIEVAPQAENINPGDVQPRLLEVEAENLRLKEQLQQEKNQNKDLQAALTTCTNNLNRMRQEYSELEAENTQNKNQATLYRQESEQFKRERDEARNFFRSSPMPDNDRTRTSGTIGLGRNFANMFKNTKNINYSITAIHTDYNNRVRSKSQTMANLGYYFNYLIDDILKVLDTYLGDKEKAYLTSKKVNEGNLRGLRQKRDASNEKPPQAPKIVGLDDF